MHQHLGYLNFRYFISNVLLGSNQMAEQIEALGQAVYAITRRRMGQAWSRLETGDALLELASSALKHVVGTVAGFRLLCGARVDSQNGCSFCCDLAYGLDIMDPKCSARWRAFSTAAESKTPAGFSQAEALAGLRVSPAATAARLVPWPLLVWGVFLGSPAVLHAEPPIAAAARSPAVQPMAPGDHFRKLVVDGLERSCLIHLPVGLDPAKPAPLVLAIHGAAMNAHMMRGFSGMNAQADAAKFIVAYPNGTGLGNAFLTWNSGGLGPLRKEPDDVAFFRALLDDLTSLLNIDPRRIYAAGMSNGGMMCYRLAAEMPDRIAAIAAVGGTLALTDPHPARPVPLIHFHGTDDRVVPYAGPRKRNPAAMSFLSVPETIETWVKLTNCPRRPVIHEVPDCFDDGTAVRITTYGPGPQNAEVVLVDINGGGHTWPGQQPGLSLIGKSTSEISANQMIWTFFEKHPMPPAPAAKAKRGP